MHPRLILKSVSWLNDNFILESIDAATYFTLTADLELSSPPYLPCAVESATTLSSG
jgi:hypothetical protein